MAAGGGGGIVIASASHKPHKLEMEWKKSLQMVKGGEERFITILTRRARDGGRRSKINAIEEGQDQ